MVLFLTGGFKPQAFENVNQVLEANLQQHFFPQNSRFDTIDIYIMEIEKPTKVGHFSIQGQFAQKSHQITGRFITIAVSVKQHDQGLHVCQSNYLVRTQNCNSRGEKELF